MPLNIRMLENKFFPRAHLDLYATGNMERMEWLRLRQNFIGASDVGTIMGYNEYFDNIALFYQKVGATALVESSNMHTHAGHVFEPVIATSFWPYWDPNNPTIEAYEANLKAKNKVRSCQRILALASNKVYPWLGINIDRIFGVPLRILEIKNIRSMAKYKWEAGISPMYVLQVMTMLAVTQTEEAELFQLVDGREPDCTPIGWNDAIIHRILKETEDFARRVKEGVRIWQSADTEEKRLARLQEVEPTANTGEAYQFLKDRYKPENSQGDRDASEHEIQLALAYKAYDAGEKQNKKAKELIKAELTQSILTSNFDRVLGPKNTYISVGGRFSISKNFNSLLDYGYSPAIPRTN